MNEPPPSVTIFKCTHPNELLERRMGGFEEFNEVFWEFEEFNENFMGGDGWMFERFMSQASSAAT